MNVERWQQQNPPMSQDDKSMTAFRHATIYKFDKNGKIIEVRKAQ